MYTVRDLEQAVRRYETLMGGSKQEHPRRFHNFVLKKLRGGMHPNQSGGGGGKKDDEKESGGKKENSGKKKAGYNVTTPPPKWMEHHKDPHKNPTENPMHLVDDHGNTPPTVDAYASKSQVAAALAATRAVPLRPAQAPHNTPTDAYRAELEAVTPDTPATDLNSPLTHGTDDRGGSDDDRPPPKSRRRLDMEGGQIEGMEQIEGGGWNPFRRKKPTELVEIPTRPTRPKAPEVPATELLLEHLTKSFVYDPQVYHSKREWAQATLPQLYAKEAKYAAVVNSIDDQLTEIRKRDDKLEQQRSVYFRGVEAVRQQKEEMNALATEQPVEIVPHPEVTAYDSESDKIARYHEYLQANFPSTTWPPEADWPRLANAYSNWQASNAQEATKAAQENRRARKAPPFGFGGLGYINPNAPRPSRPPSRSGAPPRAPPRWLPNSRPLSQTRPPPPPPPKESRSSPINIPPHNESGTRPNSKHDIPELVSLGIEHSE